MPPRKKAKNAAAHKRRTQRRTESQGADYYRGGKGKDGSCPIVGIGGSAGGFEAAMELLRHLPSRTGMAFVIVQHLDPHHASRLPMLLSKATVMPVIELAGTTTPRPDTVYVQPPNECVIVKGGALKLVRRTQKLNLAIDHFFESLAEERGSRAIGIILSGSGTDGTAGLRAIKAASGLTFAQSRIDRVLRQTLRSGGPEEQDLCEEKRAHSADCRCCFLPRLRISGDGGEIDHERPHRSQHATSGSS
jgi:chemotaxis response regulator CheB